MLVVALNSVAELPPPGKAVAVGLAVVAAGLDGVGLAETLGCGGGDVTFAAVDNCGLPAGALAEFAVGTVGVSASAERLARLPADPWPLVHAAVLAATITTMRAIRRGRGTGSG